MVAGWFAYRPANPKDAFITLDGRCAICSLTVFIRGGVGLGGRERKHNYCEVGTEFAALPSESATVITRQLLTSDRGCCCREMLCGCRRVIHINKPFHKIRHGPFALSLVTMASADNAVCQGQAS